MPDAPEVLTDALREREVELIRFETTLMREAWGDYVDRTEYLRDDPSFAPNRSIAITSIDDRKDGRFRPVYETEQDLAYSRAAARTLATLSGVRTGALDALANYTFSTGYKFEAAPEDETHQQSIALAVAVQRVIDQFVDDNDFSGLLDRESHQRSREDGETLLAFDDEEIRKGRVIVEFLEPDQLVEPASPYQLEEWIESKFPACIPDGPSCWKFGVHTPQSKTWKPLGYHIVRDGIGRDWDYYPAWRVEHIKRNVTRNAKRGVTDFFEIISDLNDEAKLCRNMVRGGALQAAVAWILQGAQGTMQSQLSSVGGESRITTSQPSPLGPNASSTVRNGSHYPCGTILKVPFGQEYLPGPMGAERNAGFELVGQYALRRIGVRWNMPEYMISGDASNANYSSTLVAGSPFAEARKADQQFYKRHFLSLLWKAVRVHVESGRFVRYGIGRKQFDDLVRFVRIECECPTVDVRDPKIAVDSDKVLVDGGIMSKQTWAARNGLDYDKEQKLGALEKPPEPVVSPFGAPPGPLGAKQPPQPGTEEGGDQRPPAQQTIEENCGTGAGGFQPGNTCARGVSDMPKYRPGLHPPNEITDEDKFDSMVDSFRRGESLPPVAAWGDRAVTGSHRIFAQDKAHRLWAKGAEGWEGAPEPGLEVVQISDADMHAAFSELGIDDLDQISDWNDLAKALHLRTRDPALKAALADQIYESRVRRGNLTDCRPPAPTVKAAIDESLREMEAAYP